MKAARSYVFLLVPILIERVAHTKVANGFCAGSNGSLPPDPKYVETARWRVRHSDRCETQALPSDLFWTWFVDNPRPPSKLL
jgi:hypothetical protein